MKKILFLFLLCSTSLMAKVWLIDGAGTGTAAQGTTWAQAITVDTFQVAAVSAMDTAFIRAGTTHTLHANFDKSTSDMTATTMVYIIAVKAGTTHEGGDIVSSDYVDYWNDMPLIDCGSSYTFKVGTYYYLQWISFQGATNNLVYLEARSVVDHCKFNENYGTPNSRYGLYTLQSCKVINCWFVSTNCSGMTAGAASIIDGCYFQDIKNATGGVGLLTAGDNVEITNCIFDSCRIGISTANRDMVRVRNSAFYACTKGISGSTDFNLYIKNNIFSLCDTGAVLTAKANSNVQRNNTHYLSPYGNIDTAGLYADPAILTSDPLFTAPAASNFSLQSASPSKNTGLGIDTLWAK